MSRREIHLEEVTRGENVVSPFSSFFREVTSPCGRNKGKHNGTFFHRVDDYDNMPAFSPVRIPGKDEKAPEVQRFEKVPSEMLAKITFWNVSRARGCSLFQGG